MSVSRAELLKRYGSVDQGNPWDPRNKDKQKKKKKKKKKKKDKHKPRKTNVMIIDEDVDWRTLKKKESDDEDEAPAVVTKAKTEEEEEDPLWKAARMRAKLEAADGSGWTAADTPKPAAGDNNDSDSDMSPRRARHDSDNDDDDDDDLDVRRRRHDSGDDDSDDSDLDVRRQPARHDSDDDDDDDDMEPRRQRHDSDSDDDIPVRRRHDSDSDDDPPVRRRHDSDDSDMSPRRGADKRKRRSPPPATHSHKKVKQEKDDKHEDAADDEDEPKVSAGLHRGSDFAKYAAAKKAKEEAALAKMGPDAAGLGADTVIRDRRGRKLKSLQKHLDRARGVYVEDEEDKMEWGKGLVQDREKEKAKLEAQKNSDKPFARTADDVEMNMEMASRERFGDPMLAYIRKKSQKKVSKAVKGIEQRTGVRHVARPMYTGRPWPNRFNILPGYRWDGKDRSNGWERKRFLKLNERGVSQRSAYKWSSENM